MSLSILGLGGLLVADEAGWLRVYPVVEPASRWYAVMTKSEWMPYLRVTTSLYRRVSPPLGRSHLGLMGRRAATAQVNDAPLSSTRKGGDSLGRTLIQPLPTLLPVGHDRLEQAVELAARASSSLTSNPGAPRPSGRHCGQAMRAFDHLVMTTSLSL